jgi:ferric-dicitrate binding protein FerR (iron transport regulator)
MKRILTLVLALLVPSASALAAQGAVVSKLDGEAVILRGAEAIPAAVGSECRDGDRLVTSPACVADVSVNGLAGCRVLQDTEIAMASVRAEDMRVEVKKGNVILNLDKLPKDSSFRVETPTAVATVRGTQFWGRVDAANPDNPVTTFAVREGSVEILAKAAGKSFVLEQGQALDIPLDAAAAPQVRPALEAEMQAMAQADSIRTSA